MSDASQALTTERERPQPAAPAAGSMARREAIAAYLFLLPNIIGFLIFTAIAVTASLVISLTNWDLLSPPRFIGLANYVKLFTNDPTFGKVLVNTIAFTAGSVPLATAIGLGLALVMNQPLRGVVLYRALYFLPVVTSMVVVALIWRWLYNPDFGVVNYALGALGVRQPPNWLTSPAWAMPAVILMAVWKQVGYTMVIYLAGLQAIPGHLYEAASIDGAGGWQRFRHITLPMLTPTTFFVLIISVINSFQVFDAVLVLTGGGPADATRTLVVYIYDQAFTYLQMGYGAAIAWVLCLIIFVITVIQWRLQGRWVYYD